MAEILKELDTIQEQVEEAKRVISENTGKVKSFMERLKTEENIKTITQAQKEIQKIDAQIETNKAEIEKELEKMREQYEW